MGESAEYGIVVIDFLSFKTAYRMKGSSGNTGISHYVAAGVSTSIDVCIVNNDCKCLQSLTLQMYSAYIHVDFNMNGILL